MVADGIGSISDTVSIIADAVGNQFHKELIP